MHSSIHDGFGSPITHLRRQHRRSTVAVITTIAIVVACLDLAWGMFGRSDDSTLRLFWTAWNATAILFAVFAGCATLLRSSREGLGLASVSLAIVTAQLVLVCVAFNFGTRQPSPGIASQMKGNAADDKDASMLDLAVKWGILSDKERDHIEERRAASQVPRWGNPMPATVEPKESPFEK